MLNIIRRFGGFPLTHDQWEKQRLALEADLLVGRLKYKSGEYMTTGYDSPWKQGKRLDVIIYMTVGKLFNSGGMRSGCSARRKITTLAMS